MKLALVLSTHSARFEAVALKGDFEANLARIAGWGYDGVELAVRDPGLVDAGEMEHIISANGLEVPAIGTGQAWGEEHLSFTDPDEAVRRAAIERITAHVPLAVRFKAFIIIGLIRGVTPAGQTKERSLQFLGDALKECADAAAGKGVRLVIEPLNRNESDLVNTTAEGMELIGRVGAGNIGLLFDTFHAAIEEPDIEQSIRLHAERIWHVHVADSNRWYPGAGQLDFPAILRTLYSCGYRGYLSGEFLPKPDPATAAQSSIATLKKIALGRFGSDQP